MEKELRSIRNILLFFLLIVILYICKLLSAIVIPLLLAFFLGLLLYPIMKFLKTKKVPTIIALFLTVLFPMPFVSLVLETIRVSVMKFYGNAEELKLLFYQKMNGYGLEVVELQSYWADLTSELDLSSIVSSIGGQATQVVGSSITVILYLFFILAGLVHYKEYFARLEGVYEGKWALAFEQVKLSISVYIRVKFAISFLLGLCVWISCVLFGVKFALFWGFICFVLNFIPSFGSIIASSCCILFSFLYLSPLELMFFAATQFGIQLATGNVLEPIFLDSKLSINPLIIIIGLFFWGYIFGVIGALLSVPLVVLFKIVAYRTPGLENWAKVMESSSTGSS